MMCVGSAVVVGILVSGMSRRREALLASTLAQVPPREQRAFLDPNKAAPTLLN